RQSATARPRLPSRWLGLCRARPARQLDQAGLERPQGEADKCRCSNRRRADRGVEVRTRPIEAKERNMNLRRRQFLRLATGAAALPMVPWIARAQTYPTRQIRWIVGFAAGGAADTMVRILGAWLSKRLGQPVVVENKPGAATNISIQDMAHSPPDGYTLALTGSSTAINTSLYRTLPFKAVQDIAPVAGLVTWPLVLEAPPSGPPETGGALL